MTTSHRHLGSLEFERKYLLAESRIEAVANCLRRLARVDPIYPENVVSSIYFDTPSFRLLGEKVDSQLYKTKIRLRWYESEGGRPEGKVAFLEVKSRIGSRRAKWRRPVDLDLAYLAKARLTDPAIGRVCRLLEVDPTVAIEGLAPVLVVRYRRRRFRDPASDSRLSIDDRICAGRTNPRLLAGSRHVRLPDAVLEVKNSTGTLPRQFGFLSYSGARASSFSKYHACVDGLTYRAFRAA